MKSKRERAWLGEEGPRSRDQASLRGEPSRPPYESLCRHHFTVCYFGCSSLTINKPGLSSQCLELAGDSSNNRLKHFTLDFSKSPETQPHAIKKYVVLNPSPLPSPAPCVVHKYTVCSCGGWSERLLPWGPAAGGRRGCRLPTKQACLSFRPACPCW